MNFEDPLVRRVGKIALAALVLALLAISGLTAWLVFDWDGQSNNSRVLVRAVDALPRLSGERTSDFLSLMALIAGALPAMVAPVCFTSVDGSRLLNRFGGFMVLVLLLVLVLSAVGYLGIDTMWKDGHALELEGLVHAQQWARAVLSASVFYLSALLGIKGKS
ncbi:hypothetical protein LP414_09405 [Polaromonas sp. P1(28)-13]|nr:hypothetical protein LP414_09405 [Polaromonas sp. P1(28)-13]